MYGKRAEFQWYKNVVFGFIVWDNDMVYFRVVLVIV